MNKKYSVAILCMIGSLVLTAQTIAQDSLSVGLPAYATANFTLADSTMRPDSSAIDFNTQLRHRYDAIILGALPLAPNNSGLSRPKFETIRFGFAIGLMSTDLSALEPFVGTADRISVPVSLNIQVPITADPSFSLMGGFGWVVGGGGGGHGVTVSSFLLYRAGNYSYFKPILGLGVGYVNYGYDQGEIIINISQTYPELLLGMNIVPDVLDVMVTFPLAGSMQTSFESNSYTIKPAGLGMNLLLSL